MDEIENELETPKEVINAKIENQYGKLLLRLALEHVECKRLACRIKDYLGIGYAKNQVDIYKSLLTLALPIVEEMASLTESPDDADLAAEIKDCLGDE